MNYYWESLKKRVRQIQSDFEISKNIVHNVSKGTYRELIIKNILRPFLPNCYGIAGGEAFDSNGNMSKQLDCVIYDSLHSYAIPFTDNFIQFPCESIFGNIEIKSKLTSDSLEDAIKNIASLKNLHRNPIENFQVNPMLELKINNIHWDINVAANDMFGIIFAFESISIDNLLQKLLELSRSYPKEYLPNRIVLFNEKVIISRFQKEADNSYTLHPLGNYEGFCAINYGNDILADFIVTLLIMLRCIQLKTMDIEDLIRCIQTEALSKYSSTLPNVVIS